MINVWWTWFAWSTRRAINSINAGRAAESTRPRRSRQVTYWRMTAGAELVYPCRMDRYPCRLTLRYHHHNRCAFPIGELEVHSCLAIIASEIHGAWQLGYAVLLNGRATPHRRSWPITSREAAQEKCAQKSSMTSSFYTNMYHVPYPSRGTSVESRKSHIWRARESSYFSSSKFLTINSCASNKLPFLK